MSDFPVYVIKRTDGLPLDAIAREALNAWGYHFDEELGGFIIEGDSFPAAFSVFLPMHSLDLSPVTVAYDPQWYELRESEPFQPEELLPWNGGEVKSADGTVHVFVWFQSASENNARPFLASWDGSKALWKLNGRLFLPDATLNAGWKILATFREHLSMTYHRLDAANNARLDREKRNQITNDNEGCAIQVAINAKRLVIQLA